MPSIMLLLSNAVRLPGLEMLCVLSAGTVQYQTTELVASLV